MSAFRRSSAGLLALLLLARGAAAQSFDSQPSTPLVNGASPTAPRAPTAAQPTAPSMPQVAPVNAGGSDTTSDVIATPFGPMSKSGISSPVIASASSKGGSSGGGAPGPSKPATSKSGGPASKSSAASKAPVAAPVETPPVESAAPVAAAPIAPPAVILTPAPAAAPSGDPSRTWLRDKPKAAEAAPKEEPATSPWRALMALLVVAGLGGFAFVARQRRGKTQAIPPSASRIVVLSSAKIGPKANAVVAEVAGRVFLLGVTDSSVSKLAVLGQDARASRARATIRKDDFQKLELDDDERRALLKSRRAPVETADVDDLNDESPRERPLSSKFGEMLDRALGVRSPAGVPDFRGNPAVAALLASDVEDTFTSGDASPRRRPESALGRPASRAARTITAEVIEEQVAGLSRKRRRA